MANNPAAIGSIRCGLNSPMVLIAGPCVVESLELAQEIARHLRDLVVLARFHSSSKRRSTKPIEPVASRSAVVEWKQA